MSSIAWSPRVGVLVHASTRRRGATLLALFALGLLARLVLVFTHRGTLESWEYETLAENIVRGQGYTIIHFGHVAFAFGDGNLYSFLAAAVYVVVGHHPVALGVVQAMLAALIGPLLFELAERPLGYGVAVLGAVLAALHPGLLAYSLKLHPLGLDAVLLASSVLWIRRAGPGRQHWLPAGLAMGLTLMSRPTFFVAGLAAMIVRWRVHRGSALALVMAVALGTFVALPWVARNWAVLGRPVFMTTSLEDVWKGTNPWSSGSGLLPDGQDAFAAAPPGMRYHFSTLDEVDLNAYFGEEVAEFATRQPVAFAGLVARKFVYFWWASPQMGMLYPPEWLHAYLAYAAVVLALAGVGALSIVRRGGAEARALVWTIGATSLTIATLHALAYVEGRHRWGVEPLLLLLTAQGIWALGGSVGRAVVRE